MSDKDNTEKKGFFSKLFGGLSSSSEKDDSINKEQVFPSRASLNKMKKANIVSLAKENDLELDVNLTKAELLSKWDLHFSVEAEITEPVEAAQEEVAETEAEEPVEAAQEEVAETEAEEPVEAAQEEVAETEAEEPVEAAQEEVAETEAEEPVEAAQEEVAETEAEEPVEAAQEEVAETEAEEPVEAAQEEVAETEAEEVSDISESKPVAIEEKTSAQIINTFESEQLKEDVPSFRPGDTVVISVKVKEGERTRLQAFEGVVMSIKNAGLNSSFIVRKISSGIGVERTFQTHSPIIDSISVKRKGEVRQAKLYYLRERSGRSARIKERLD